MKNLLKDFVDAFYNPIVYRNAIQRWQGFGGKYLAFLGFVLATILTANILYNAHLFEARELPYLLEQIPPIKIEKGILAVESDRPVTIQSRNKLFNATIDTTKNEKELRDTKTMLGVGNTYVFFQANGEYKPFYFKELGNAKLQFDKRSLLQLWDDNVPAIKVIMLPLMWLGQIINLVIQGFFVAVLSYLVTAFMREEYDFLTRMRLSILALTPATIITTLLSVVFNHQAAPWFSLLLACLYIYVMIVLIRRLPVMETASSI